MTDGSKQALTVKSAYASPNSFDRTEGAGWPVIRACMGVLPVPVRMTANYVMSRKLGCGTPLAAARVLVTGPKDFVSFMWLVIVPWASGLIGNLSGGISVRRVAGNVNGANTRVMM